MQLVIETALQKHKEYRQKVEIIQDKGLGKGVPSKSPEEEVSWEERPRILIVEDEIITAMDLAAELEEMGYLVVDTVGTGYETIRKSELFRPDLILMDIVLSGELDGIEVAKQLHDLDIPVVYLSAYTDDATVEKAKNLPYGYLPKPYQIDELYSTIETALQQHKSETEKIEK